MTAVALIASLIISLAYYGISAIVASGLIASGQLGSNRLATATAAIFFTCGLGHSIHAVHLADGSYVADWHLAVWDVVTAVIAVLYLSLRRSFGALLLFDDLERRRLQEQLATERGELAEAQAVARVGSWTIDIASGRHGRSAELLRIFGISAAGADAAAIWERIHDDDRARVETALARLTAEGEPLDESYRIDRDGSERILHARGRREAHPGTGELRVLGTVQDVTETSRLHERFQVAFEQAGVAMTIIGLEGDDRGRVAAANEAYAELLGRPLDEIVGQSVTSWMHPDDLEDSFATPLGRLAAGETERVQFERRYLHGDGHVVWALVTNATFTDETGRRVAIGQILDISERKRFEGQLQHLADHDALTGLFNRRRFEEELERLLAHARRFGGRGAVLAIDLDGFKFVNDSLGHAVGDDLVARLGGILQRGLRETDVVARTGGDEFAVVLPQTDGDDALRVATKLLEEIRRGGTVVRGHRHAQVTASIGITTFTRADDVSAEDLLVEADIAMYDAKAEGKDRCVLYRPDDRPRDRIAVRENWRARLIEAIDEQRFVLYAQPIVAVCVAGDKQYELLLRLPDDHDLIPPGTFLYNAERFGLMEQIDRWVMGEAVALLHAHHAAGNDISLSVNMSARTLNAGGVAEHLAELLERHRVPDGKLVIEVTETAAISNIEQARELARDVRALGCRLALDDFGAGFATFYYLKHLDFDFVKIDGEFIKRLPATPADQLVVRAVVDIARGLGSETIAEFVQDDETIELLQQLGVGYAQGYHTGRPGSLESVLPALAGVA